MKKALLIFSIFAAITLILANIFICSNDDRKPGLNNSNPIIFAHRGVRFNSVENSKESFENTTKYGFSAVETDLNITKDGKLVIFHDENAKRLLDINEKIQNLSWNDISDKALFHNQKLSENKVLLLEEFLDIIDKDMIVYLDIKARSLEVRSKLIKILRKSDKKNNIIIADANLTFLLSIRRRVPEVRIALEGYRPDKRFLHSKLPNWCKPDYFSSSINKATKENLDYLRENDLLKRRIIYGINPKNIDKLYKIGGYNIIYYYDKSSESVEEIERNILENANM